MSEAYYRIWNYGTPMAAGEPRDRDTALRFLTRRCGFDRIPAELLLNKAGEPGDLAFVYAGVTVEAVEAPE